MCYEIVKDIRKKLLEFQTFGSEEIELRKLYRDAEERVREEKIFPETASAIVHSIRTPPEIERYRNSSRTDSDPVNADRIHSGPTYQAPEIEKELLDYYSAALLKHSLEQNDRDKREVKEYLEKEEGIGDAFRRLEQAYIVDIVREMKGEISELEYQGLEDLDRAYEDAQRLVEQRQIHPEMAIDILGRLKPGYRISEDKELFIEHYGAALLGSSAKKYGDDIEELMEDLEGLDGFKETLQELLEI